MTVAGPGWIPASQLTTLQYDVVMESKSCIQIAFKLAETPPSTKWGCFVTVLWPRVQVSYKWSKMRSVCRSDLCRTEQNMLHIQNVPLLWVIFNVDPGDIQQYPIRSWCLQIHFCCFLCCFNHPDLVWCHSFLLYCLIKYIKRWYVVILYCHHVRYFNLQKRPPTSSAPHSEPQEFGALVARMPATSRETKCLLCRWIATSIALDYDGSTRCVTGHFKEIRDTNRIHVCYSNIYHQFTPNVSIYTIHGSYGICEVPVVWQMGKCVAKMVR